MERDGSGGGDGGDDSAAAAAAAGSTAGGAEPMQAEARSGGEASTSEAAGAAAAAADAGGEQEKKPTVVLVIGMAGSGKTTLIRRLHAHLHARKTPAYIINLDPAVAELPYAANIDIRDTVDYRSVMKQYGLGPNGGILTACNLFATRFDQVIKLVEQPRAPPLQYVVADTPGQIEIFTWSASGQLVTELFAATLPTVVLYVLDTPRCAAPQSFMSNMLQAVSILYKTRLPLLLAFNKVDVVRHEFALTWMRDFEAYATALEADASYAATLSRSLSLVLEEFYEGLRTAGVSALTGEGVDELFEAIDAAAKEYHDTYVPDLRARAAAKQEAERRRRERELGKLRRDMAAASLGEQGRGGGGKGGGGSKGGAAGASSSGAAAAAAGGGGGGAGGGRAAGAGAGAAAAAAAAAAAGDDDDDDDGGQSADLELSDDSIEGSVGVVAGGNGSE